MGLQVGSKQSNLYGLILAGGAGTRLWPISRASQPKQLLPLTGTNQSLLQEAFSRLARTICENQIVTVTGRNYAEQAWRQLCELAPEFRLDNILAEPVGRDSAPAVLWGALHIAHREPDAVIALVWSDQLIRLEEAFDAALQEAYQAVRDGGIVMLGVPARRPLTTLGYIKRGAHLRDGVFRVEQFIEKPARARAQQLVIDGTYLWNPGVLVFKAATMIREFEMLAPEIAGHFNRHGAEHPDNDWSDAALIEVIYQQLSRNSIDYMVLEKTDQLGVIPVELGWSDLGTWDELYRQHNKDEDGNALAGNVIALDTHNTYVRAGKRLIATVGVEDLVVVDTDDAVLVCDMRKVRDVQQLVEQLRKRGLPEADSFEHESRPWGSYAVLAKGPGFQVKVLRVNPGQKLSLQLHHHRDEHWVVVSGEARLTCDDHVGEYPVNGHLFVSRGTKHRIENTGTEPLNIIEVQYGSYLGEDDVVRFEDIYGRSSNAPSS